MKKEEKVEKRMISHISIVVKESKRKKEKAKKTSSDPIKEKKIIEQQISIFTDKDKDYQKNQIIGRIYPFNKSRGNH